MPTEIVWKPAQAMKASCALIVATIVVGVAFIYICKAPVISAIPLVIIMLSSGTPLAISWGLEKLETK